MALECEAMYAKPRTTNSTTVTSYVRQMLMRKNELRYPLNKYFMKNISSTNHKYIVLKRMHKK